MRSSITTAMGMAAVACALAGVGCWQRSGSEPAGAPGVGERAGAAVDRAAEKTVDAAKATAEATKDAAGRAVEKTGEVVEKAGAAVERAGAGMQTQATNPPPVE
jgi:hypothetical protein